VSAIRDPDPVVFMEPKALYHAVKEEVPEEVETLELGRARLVRAGGDVTVVAYGTMLHRVLEAAEVLKDEDGVEAEVVDLLTISPMDGETVAASVRKTGRVVVVHEAPRTCGIGAELTARVVEKAFLQLAAPVRRLTGFDITYPGFAREKAWFPDVPRIVSAVRETLAF